MGTGDSIKEAEPEEIAAAEGMVLFLQGTEIFDCFCESNLQRDFGQPVEEFFGEGDVGFAARGIVWRKRF